MSYTVEEPGEYTVGIRFNEKHIPGSPYKVYIQVMVFPTSSKGIKPMLMAVNLESTCVNCLILVGGWRDIHYACVLPQCRNAG